MNDEELFALTLLLARLTLAIRKLEAEIKDLKEQQDG